MLELPALVTSVVGAVVGAVVAAMIPAVRRWVGAIVRPWARCGQGLLSKIQSRGNDAPTANPSKQEHSGEAARSRAASGSGVCGTNTVAEPSSGSGAGVITVRRDGAPLAGAQALVLFPDKTWVHAVADSEGTASLDLRSVHLPTTVFVAANECTAHVEIGWIPVGGALAVDLSPLPDGGSTVIKQGTGHIPGLAGRLNPIRDASDRTYLYADNIAINRGEPQPVSFVPGDEQMHLVDANGNKFVVRVAAITGRSSLIEYRRVRKDSCP